MDQNDLGKDDWNLFCMLLVIMFGVLCTERKANTRKSTDLQKGQRVFYLFKLLDV